MLPRWHILSGAIFTLVIWIFSPGISYLYLGLIFLSSFLIDFDHYLVFAYKTGKWKLGEAFHYYKLKTAQEKKDIQRGIKRRSDFQIFHTIEFHVLVGLLGIFWIGFFYIFIGMMFHSLLDVISLLNARGMHLREFFFFNWMATRKN